MKLYMCALFTFYVSDFKWFFFFFFFFDRLKKVACLYTLYTVQQNKCQVEKSQIYTENNIAPCDSERNVCIQVNILSL